MTTAVALDEPRPAPPLSSAPIRIALLGLGQVGAAVARAATDRTSPLSSRLRIVGALVRDTARARDVRLPLESILSADAEAVFGRRPDVAIELLGGVEPAFTLVRCALERGVAVVTANKSLLAARGPDLLILAAQTGTPFLYEASILAGVPFLGSLSRRPLASRVSRIAGIVNGTSNFILTRMHEDGVDCGTALLDAQRRGLAEPNAHNDVRGIDAAEKLSVLLQHFGWGHARPDTIETSGIDGLRASDIEAARRFGGVVKPVVAAERSGDRVAAFAGPAFVPARSPLALIGGADNALSLHNRSGRLFYAGPGAGPDATADTVLDDVFEAAGRERQAAAASMPPPQGRLLPTAPDTGWFVRLTSGTRLPAPDAIADVLGSHGIWLRQTSAERGGEDAAWATTWRASRVRLERALCALASAARCDAYAIRTLEE